MNPAYSTKLNRKSRTRVQHTVPRYYGHAADSTCVRERGRRAHVNFHVRTS